MVKFIQLVMYTGPVHLDYLDQPAPDPSAFGLPADDDGSRDDLPLRRNFSMPAFEPDVAALRASSVRIVPAVGAHGEGTLEGEPTGAHASHSDDLGEGRGLRLHNRSPPATGRRREPPTGP